MATHIRRSASSRKSARLHQKTTACGKAKDSPVKPQNIVGIFNRTQCLFFRQTAHRSLCLSHFYIYNLLVHRVVPRSWGTAGQGHLHSLFTKKRRNFWRNTKILLQIRRDSTIEPAQRKNSSAISHLFFAPHLSPIVPYASRPSKGRVISPGETGILSATECATAVPASKRFWRSKEGNP
ncbi:MAG: hypothetical protein RL042_1129 [Nitrospirota bacterium]|jgi:hypothetical protein